MQRAAATVKVEPLNGGGVEVKMLVPTYTGQAVFALRAERDIDGDWRVFIPWEEELSDRQMYVADAEDRARTEELGYEFTNGIAYLGAPEEDDDDE